MDDVIDVLRKLRPKDGYSVEGKMGYFLALRDAEKAIAVLSGVAPDDQPISAPALESTHKDNAANGESMGYEESDRTALQLTYDVVHHEAKNNATCPSVFSTKPT